MGTRKRRSTSRRNNGPVTTSRVSRAAARVATAKIKDNFPPGVAQPALRALLAAGYTDLDKLTQVKESDLARLHGMGPKALRLLREALKRQGKSFAKP